MLSLINSEKFYIIKLFYVIFEILSGTTMNMNSNLDEEKINESNENMQESDEG